MLMFERQRVTQKSRSASRPLETFVSHGVHPQAIYLDKAQAFHKELDKHLVSTSV